MVGFSTQEHIDLGIKYDPGTGIYGMDFYVHLSRPGSRVKNRKLKVGKVGCAHKLKKDRQSRPLLSWKNDSVVTWQLKINGRFCTCGNQLENWDHSIVGG